MQAREEYALDDLISTDLRFSCGAEISKKAVDPTEQHDAVLFSLHYLRHSHRQSELLPEQHPFFFVSWHHAMVLTLTISYVGSCSTLGTAKKSGNYP